MLKRLELNSAGVRELLQSPGVRADITKRAERVASAAASRTSSSGPRKRDSSGRFLKGQGRGGYAVEVGLTASRVRASVRTASPAARQAEARHRALTGSLDAAR